MEEKETSILPVAIILKTILDNAQKGRNDSKESR